MGGVEVVLPRKSPPATSASALMVAEVSPVLGHVASQAVEAQQPGRGEGAGADGAIERPGEAAQDAPTSHPRRTSATPLHAEGGAIRARVGAAAQAVGVEADHLGVAHQIAPVFDDLDVVTAPAQLVRDAGREPILQRAGRARSRPTCGRRASAAPRWPPGGRARDRPRGSPAPPASGAGRRHPSCRTRSAGGRPPDTWTGSACAPCACAEPGGWDGADRARSTRRGSAAARRCRRPPRRSRTRDTGSGSSRPRCRRHRPSRSRSCRRRRAGRPPDGRRDAR